MSFGWVWAIGVAVAGGAVMWHAGLKRKSLAGATFAMLFTIAGIVVVEPSLVEQLSLLMVGGAIAMMVGAFVLIGWMWNVVGLIKWRRLQRTAGHVEQGSDSIEEWLPWIAWYPVTTEQGTAWMRFVQVRMRAVAGGAANEVMRLEFREMPAAR